MLKVLIADDEKKVGLLVKNLIQWEELQLEFMELVYDGQIAYEVIMDKRPDIVITDIRMPSLSGLDMIKKVTESSLPVHFIVISGYKYFEYAQTALKFGVKDYLLKPIDEDELNKILKKVCEEEEKKRGQKQHISVLEKNLKSSKHILHRELMEQAFRDQGIFENDMLGDEKTEYHQNEIFQAVGIKIDRNIFVVKNKDQEKLITEKLSEMLDDVLRPQVIDMVVSVKKSMWILVLFNFQKENKKSIYGVLEQLFYDMKKYMTGFENYEITMGIGNQIAEFAKINLTLEMAMEAVSCRIFEGSGIFIKTCTEGRNCKAKSEEIVQNCGEDIKKYILVFRCDELDRFIRKCFDEADKEKVMASEYYEMAKYLLTDYAQSIYQLFHEEMEEMLFRWKDELESCRTVSSIKKFVLESLKNHLKSLGEKQLDLERKPILDTIEYVKNNYEKKILFGRCGRTVRFSSQLFFRNVQKRNGKKFFYIFIGGSYGGGKGTFA